MNVTNANETLEASRALTAYLQAQSGSTGTPNPNPNPIPNPNPPPSIDPSRPGNAMSYELDWNNPQRISTRGLGPQDRAVVGFTTGGKSSHGNLPHINIADGTATGAAIQPRDVVISENPDDFDNVVYRSEGIVTFCLGEDHNPFYPTLRLNTRYYCNIRFRQGASGACDVDVDLNKAGDL